VAEIDQKLNEYFQSGVQVVWVIDPKPRMLAIYTNPKGPAQILREGDTLDGGEVLPGFSAPIATLFKNIPPLA